MIRAVISLRQPTTQHHSFSVKLAGGYSGKLQPCLQLRHLYPPHHYKRLARDYQGHWQASCYPECPLGKQIIQPKPSYWLEQQVEQNEHIPQAVQHHRGQQVACLEEDKGEYNAQQQEGQECLQPEVAHCKEQGADEDGPGWGHVPGKGGQQEATENCLESMAGWLACWLDC